MKNVTQMYCNGVDKNIIIITEWHTNVYGFQSFGKDGMDRV